MTPEIESRTALLKAARKLFAENGFDGTTVADLAKEAKVNISLVSYYFDGKEGLYRECLEEISSTRFQMIERLLTPPRDQEDIQYKLELLFNDVIDYHTENPEVTTILHRECSSNYDFIGEAFQNTILKLFNQLKDFLVQAQQKEIIRADSDPFILTSILYGSLLQSIRTEPLQKQNFKVSIFKEPYRTHFIKTSIQQFLFGCIHPSLVLLQNSQNQLNHKVSSLKSKP